MARADVPRFIETDTVIDANGRTGTIVMSFPRKTDGKTFPMVRILTGEGSGTRVWADHHWTPLIDWSRNGQVITCRECDRHFRDCEEVGKSEIFCRTCSRAFDTRERAMRVDASPSHQYGRRPGRR